MKPFVTVSRKCRLCHSCLEVCTTGAIRLEDGKPFVDASICLLDGACVKNCPQENLSFTSGLPQVEALLKTGNRLAVSLAPSYKRGLAEPRRVIGALRQLGFDIVEEALCALPQLAVKRLRLLEKHPAEAFFTSSCPSVVHLVNKEFPHLVNALEPSPSPMVLHGKSLKERYGRLAVVFVGPCPAKRVESRRSAGAIDEVLTFDDLEKLCERNGFSLEDAPESYPDSEGEAWTLKAPYVVDIAGISECRRFLAGFPDNAPKGHVVEILACEGGCLNGPGMPVTHRLAKEIVKGSDNL